MNSTREFLKIISMIGRLVTGILLSIEGITKQDSIRFGLGMLLLWSVSKDENGSSHS
jgi:hypothetical protein